VAFSKRRLFRPGTRRRGAAKQQKAGFFCLAEAGWRAPMNPHRELETAKKPSYAWYSA
jgi:hypothetical protein